MAFEVQVKMKTSDIKASPEALKVAVDQQNVAHFERMARRGWRPERITVYYQNDDLGNKGWFVGKLEYEYVLALQKAGVQEINVVAVNSGSETWPETQGQPKF